MTYQALYRKYRPGTFQELVGQEAISRTLINAVTKSRLAHAYLFTGPRGTGKTSTARILAKSVNCENGPTESPCGECANCKAITAGTSLDVYEIDAASNRGIDDMRELRERVRLAPVSSRYKVYIIDEVHMLTQEAFNALLKTLEEPPPNMLFILATTEPHKVLATIHSRCQRFDFSRIALAPMVAHLEDVAKKESIQINHKALERIAKRSGGGLRDALSLLDQIAAIASGDAIDEPMVENALGMVPIEGARHLAEALADRDLPTAVTQVGTLLASGFEHQAILRELIEVFRHLVLLKIAPKGADAFEVPESEREGLLAIAKRFEREEVIRCLEELAASETLLRQGLAPTIALELILAKIASRQPAADLSEIEKRLQALEQRLEGARVEPRAEARPSEPPFRAPEPPVRKAPPLQLSQTPQKPQPVAEPPARPIVSEAPKQFDLMRDTGPSGDIDRFFSVLKGISPPVAAILQSGALSVKDGELEIALPPAWKDYFQDGRKRQVLEQAIKGTFGNSIPYHIEGKDAKEITRAAAPKPQAKAPAAASAPPSASVPAIQPPEDDFPIEGDLVQVTAELFNGKIIEGKSSS